MKFNAGGVKLGFNAIKLLESISTVIDFDVIGAQPDTLEAVLKLNGFMLENIADTIREMAHDMNMMAYFSKINGTAKQVKKCPSMLDESLKAILSDMKCDCPDHKKKLRTELEKLMDFMTTTH